MFTRFDTMVDERTHKLIGHGRRIRAVLRQPQFAPLPLGEQIALLLAVAEGILDDIPLDRADAFCAGLGTWLAQYCREALALDDQTTRLSEDLQGRVKAALKELARSIAGLPAGDQS